MHTPHLISPPTAFARLTRSPAKLMALGHAPKNCLAPHARVALVLYAPGPDGTYCVRQCVHRSHAQAVASLTIAGVVSARVLVRKAPGGYDHRSGRVHTTCAAVTGSCAQAAALLTIAGAVSVCARSAYAAVTGRWAASVRVGRCAQVAASPTIVGIFAHQRNHRDRVRAMRRCAKRVHHGHAPIVTSLIPGVASVHAAWCKPSPGSRPCYI
ncbi:hypothetical protein B0H14DRAFT_2582051 [Mycena olivaceomarginata]|nr:hypothetical protein B0H14DRAFT_2582051 [Mycena olivaceomarginata]